MLIDPLPYLTADLPGIGGSYKSTPEDFRVDETLAYEPTGEGDHLYMYVQKANMTTIEAANQLAKHLGRKSYDVGYAGMKDKNAITRQWFSIEHATDEDFEDFRHEQMNIYMFDRHVNKIKLGHVKSNRFLITIRDVDPIAVVRAKPIMDQLEATGLPNYFGEQRFGFRGNNHKLGQALLENDADAFFAEFLGKPTDNESPQTRKAREAYEASDLAAAHNDWPHAMREERRLLGLLKDGVSPRDAMFVLKKKERQLFISALQSMAFNQVLAARITNGDMNNLLTGDIAIKLPTGPTFTVEDAAKEQPRVDVKEIAPTGPLPGKKMKSPVADAALLENEILSELALSDLSKEAARTLGSGERRALFTTIETENLAGGMDENGPYLTLTFHLTTGSFATAVLREVMK